MNTRKTELLGSARFMGSFRMPDGRMFGPVFDGDDGTGSGGAAPKPGAEAAPAATANAGGDGSQKPPVPAGGDQGAAAAGVGGQPAASAEPKPGDAAKPGEAAKPPGNETPEAKAAREAAEAERKELFGYPTDGELKVTMPEGLVLDTKAMEKFVPIAKKLDLSPKGAQQLVDLHSTMVKEQTEQWANTIATWIKDTKADAEISGGKGYDQNTATANKAVAAFGDPELVQILTDYGLGNHRAVVRFAMRVGAALGEDKLVPNGGNNGDGGNKPRTADVFYADQKQ